MSWLRVLKNIIVKAKILFRIQKIENDGHFENCKSVGDGIKELRVNDAKGYRIYFEEKDGKIIVLLIGGDKLTQQKDIEKAKKIGKNYINKNMETSKFDIVDYLDNNGMIAEYLNTVLEEGNSTDVINVIGYIAKAIGMTKISEETGLSRPSLYKALSDGSKPQFATIMKVLKAIGGKIQVDSISA